MDAPPTLVGPLPILPALPGVGWSIKVSPRFLTLEHSHVSGRESRAARQALPTLDFTLSYDGLSSDFNNQGLFFKSLQMLMGMILQANGPSLPFVYVDPQNDYVADVTLGVGDGVTTDFKFSYPIGAAKFLPGIVIAVDAVKLSGVAQFYNWNLFYPNTLHFYTAPSSGVAITATFNFGHICRFVNDQEDFENFMQGLHSLSALNFTTVKV